MELKITNVKTIVVAPEGLNIVTVKVETNDPAIYGVGCATFTQRYHAVVTAVEKYLKPFLLGKPVNNIEYLWQTIHAMSYWRNGPVLNNALAGVDMALWDIKAKVADMPLYELFGGKVREGIYCYTHAEADTVDGLLDRVQELTDEGYRAIRCQLGGYGGKAEDIHKPEGALPGAYFDPKVYMNTVIDAFHKIRERFGWELDLCHDVHERLAPADTIRFAKEMDQFKLFFLEDSLPPEQVQWFEHLRSKSSSPLAMGELFNNPNEWLSLIDHQLIDFIRVHISQIGGITPARKLIALCDAHGVRTAWHGPVDMTPIGHAVNAHLDIASPNFGIQEWTDSRYATNGNDQAMREIFPGALSVKDGYIYLNDKPGIGVDIDEEAAKEYPEDPENVAWDWLEAKLPDGSPAKP